MSKTPHSELDYIHRVIDLRKIDPSPYQHRRHFDKDKLRELAASIQSEGLIEPIVVRPKRERYELIAGERRFLAVRDFTEMGSIGRALLYVIRYLTRYHLDFDNSINGEKGLSP